MLARPLDSAANGRFQVRVNAYFGGDLRLKLLESGLYQPGGCTRIYGEFAVKYSPGNCQRQAHNVGFGFFEVPGSGLGQFRDRIAEALQDRSKLLQSDAPAG
jgi:hypothetical protein